MNVTCITDVSYRRLHMNTHVVFSLRTKFFGGKISRPRLRPHRPRSAGLTRGLKSISSRFVQLWLKESACVIRRYPLTNDAVVWSYDALSRQHVGARNDGSVASLAAYQIQPRRQTRASWIHSVPIPNFAPSMSTRKAGVTWIYSIWDSPTSRWCTDWLKVF